MTRNKVISTSKVGLSRPTISRVKNVTSKPPKDYKAKPLDVKEYGNISFGLTGTTGRT